MSQNDVSSDASETGERVLYGFWLSPFMSMVGHVLIELDMPFRYERVSPFLAQTRNEAHLERNPLGKIPSFHDSNGVVLSESQAICRYLARTYAPAQALYPCNDAVACAEVDQMNDFISFSIGGPLFNWFVVGGYFPQAWGAKTAKESQIFDVWSMVMNSLAVGKLLNSAQMSPYLLGKEPQLPDFQLFHLLELGKSFSEFFDMPFINFMASESALQDFYQAMAERPSTQKVLSAHDLEREETRREIFEEFGTAYADILTPAKAGLTALFGHEV